MKNSAEQSYADSGIECQPKVTLIKSEVVFIRDIFEEEAMLNRTET